LNPCSYKGRAQAIIDPKSEPVHHHLGSIFTATPRFILVAVPVPSPCSPHQPSHGFTEPLLADNPSYPSRAVVFALTINPHCCNLQETKTETEEID
jgi:hypothetical protein